MVAIDADAASAAGVIEKAIAGRTSAPSKARLTRWHEFLVVEPPQLLQERAGLGDDFDFIRAAVWNENRYPSGADFMSA
jgi:hypothetical protein